MRRGRLPERAVALTFDDGFRSVAREAAPLLRDRGVRATVFCVSGRLGGESDWPSRRPGAGTAQLADADELAALAADGWEVGCHGATHAPLVDADASFLRRELVDAETRSRAWSACR